jgi:hypothetical protein
MVAFDWENCGNEDMETGYYEEWYEYHLYINIFPGIMYKIQLEYYEGQFDFIRHLLKIKSEWLHRGTSIKLFNKYL